MNRMKLTVLWALCVAVSPVLLVMMLGQALVGSTDRALHMAIGFDQTGNALFGGSEDETISSRVGRNAVAGRRWALWLERGIDLLFGEGHCRAAVGV